MASTINVLTTGTGGISQTGDSSGILQMQKDGTATLTINTSGYVGINNTTPTARLHISQSNAGGVAAIYLDQDESTIQGPGTYTQVRMGGNLTLGANSLLALATNNTTRVQIDNTGAIGLSGANYGTSGQFLTSNGPGAAVTWTSAAAGGFSNMTVFTSPGTFTTPSTTTKIKVTVVGGGGSGGSGTNPSPTATGGGGGGGGGGAIYVGPVTASTGYPVTVGSAGGTSSFGALASATGGGNGSASPGTGASGGAGGAGSAGTLRFTGNDGGVGVSSSGFGNGGPGGGSFFGGAARGGNTGNPYGGGGGGGFGTGSPGLPGAAGVVVVEY